MLEYITFACLFIIFLILCLFYLYPGSKKVTTIPSPDPSDEKEGNLGDIRQAGSLHIYLKELHEQYGEITGFYWGEQFVVSIASSKLFSEYADVFDRPGDLYQMWSPLVQFPALPLCNGGEGRRRREKMAGWFASKSVVHLGPMVQETIDQLCAKWMERDQEKPGHIPLQSGVNAAIFRALAVALCPTACPTDQDIVAMKRNMDLVWTEMNLQDTEVCRDEVTFQKALQGLRRPLEAACQRAKNGRPDATDQGLLGVLALSCPPETVASDCLAALGLGYRPAAALVTWAIYFVASHSAVQTRLQAELDAQQAPTAADLHKFKYLHWILDETMRCVPIIPWTARVQSFDSFLGGHRIAKNIPVIQALGVVLQDEELYPEPDKFDPERFSDAAVRGRPEFAFAPFGFAGNRKCCGMSLAYLLGGIFLATVFGQFTVTLVRPDNEDDKEESSIDPAYGLVTVPNETIWIRVQARQRA